MTAIGMIRLLDCPSIMHSRGGGLDFQFGISVQPEGPNRGAFVNGPLLIVWDPSDLNFLTKYSHLK